MAERHIWRGTHPIIRPNGENVQPGEEFDPSESQLDNWADLIETQEYEPEPEPEEGESESEGEQDGADDDQGQAETESEAEAGEADDEGMHVCEECGDAFDTPQGLASHSRVHEDK